MFKYIISDSDVNRLVNIEELVEHMRRMIIDGIEAGRRVSVEYGGAWYGSMIAAGYGYFTTKLVGVYPENQKRGLPIVRAVMVAFDSSDGEPILLMDATVATAWRTAAATAVALQAMGAGKGGIVGIIGAGVQATYHALVVERLFSPRLFLIHSRTPARAEALASRLPEAKVVPLDRLLEESDVIIAATTSTSPVIRGDLLRNDAIVASVGAPKPVRELDDKVAERGKCAIVDTLQALEESDDVSGFREVVELADVLRGKKQCKWGDVRVYKSVGTSIFDHAIALYILSRLTRQNGGREGNYLDRSGGASQALWIR